MKPLRILCALMLVLLPGLILSQRYTAMDYIVKANKGKEHLMNVDKFDIRRPPHRSGAAAGQLNAAAKEKSRLWIGGVIPYVVHLTLRERPGFHNNLKKAMKQWMAFTCVNFRARKKTDRDYVVFAYATGCNADVGRRGGRQQVSLGHGCSNPGVIVHEIGHVVGFWHEQNRPDRDKYVEIKKNNIEDRYKFAFAKYTDGRINSRNVTYDFKSVMHYGKQAFSKNNKDTIVAKAKGVTELGNDHLSPLDIKQANLMYNCPERIFPRFPDDFTTTTNGSIPGQKCVYIIEPKKARHKPVWLCHKRTKHQANIRWSHSGKIKGLDCTHITSPFGDDRHRLWNNNYLCVSNDSVYKFHWVKNKPLAGLGCLRWSTYKAYLCSKRQSGPIDGGWTNWSGWSKCTQPCGGGYQEQRRYCSQPVPKNYGKPCQGDDYKKQFCNLQQCSEYPMWPNDFGFYYSQQMPKTEYCVRLYDRHGGNMWSNYFFCSHRGRRNIFMKWSDIGPKPGMRCTKIYEPSEAHGWKSNYLCAPHLSKYRFEWSHAGSISGLECIQWKPKNGSDGWNDNYLCGRRVQMKAETDGDLRPRLAAHMSVNGGWSKWSNWSQCSRSCDNGYESRSRSCTEPTPSQNGRPCSGHKREMKRCFLTDCPKPCRGEYSGNEGRLTSPQFPKYPKNSACRWIINVPAGRRVEMKFTYMHLKSSLSSCSHDNLIIKDSSSSQAPVLKHYCHNFKTPQIIHSTGSTMVLELRTTDVLDEGGFRAVWSSKPLDTCYNTFTALNGSLTSPRYPKKYPNDMKCRWLIKVPLNPLHQALKVKFEYLRLEKHKKCSYDKLEIYNGATERSPKQTLCGKNKPVKPIVAFTNSLLIKFSSDKSRTYGGFKLSWYVGKRKLD